MTSDDMVRAFLPMDRRLALATGARIDGRRRGCALFADISGFTGMAERLADEYGARRAGEELTRLLGIAYEPMVTAVQRCRGSVIGFAGDAIVAWFDEDEGERALTAAGRMMRGIASLGRRWSEQGHAIGIKVVLTKGSVVRCLVGDPEVQRVEVLFGAPIVAMGRGDAVTRRGDLVVDEALASTVERLGGELGECCGGFHRVRVPPEGADVTWPRGGRVSPQKARPWLLPPVYERLTTAPAAYLSELRSAAALFMSFAPGEETVDALDRFIRWVQGVVERRGGAVVQVTTGDKGTYLYAAFGAPVAHENVVERAGRAALDLRHPPAALGLAAPPKLGLGYGRMRTGPYGSASRMTYGVLGDETNVAARLMTMARPGQILCSSSFVAAADASLTLDNLGERALKGRRRRIEVYELRTMARRPSVSPQPVDGLVGRARELSLVARVMAGGGPHTALFLGDGGMGKTRLLAEAMRRAPEGMLCLAAEGDPLEDGTPFHPWRSLFAQLARVAGAGGAEATAREVDPDALPLFRSLLGHSPVGETSSEHAEERGEAILAAGAKVFQQLCRGQATVLFLDDLDRFDPSSLRLLERIRRTSRVAVVAAARHASEPLLAATGRPTGEARLRLKPMSRDEVITLLCAKLGVDDVSPEVAAFIVDRAEGNPYFTEQLTLALMESEVLKVQARRCLVRQQLDRASFPDTIEGMVTARIDGLSPHDQLALKVASVMGRAFREHDLRHVFPLREPESAFEARLSRLHRRGLLSPEHQKQGWLRFASEVTREVTYGLMLFAQRQSLHEAVADVLEQRCGDDLGPWRGRIAYHRLHALDPRVDGDHRRQRAAATALLEAGRYAVGIGASIEGERQLSQGLALLTTWPEGFERDGLELRLQCLRAGALVAIANPAAPAVRQTLLRARDLAERHGARGAQFEAAFGLWYGSLIASKPSSMREAAALVEVAQAAEEPGWLLQAYQALGTSIGLGGQFRDGLAALDRVVRMAAQGAEQRGMMAKLRDPLVLAHCYRAFCLWFLDSGEACRGAEAKALTLAEGEHPVTRCSALATMAVLNRLRGDDARAESLARQAAKLADEVHNPFWKMTAAAVTAWLPLARGAPERAFTTLQRWHDIHLGSDVVPVTTTLVQADLIDAATRLGRWDDAEQALEAARAGVDLRLSFGWAAEIERLAAILYARRGEHARAVSTCQRAVEIARRHEAKSLEQRASDLLAEIAP